MRSIAPWLLFLLSIAGGARAQQPAVTQLTAGNLQGALEMARAEAEEAPSDLDALASVDEAAWVQMVRHHLIY